MITLNEPHVSMMLLFMDTQNRKLVNSTAAKKGYTTKQHYLL